MASSSLWGSPFFLGWQSEVLAKCDKTSLLSKMIFFSAPLPETDAPQATGIWCRAAYAIARIMQARLRAVEEMKAQAA